MMSVLDADGGHDLSSTATELTSLVTFEVLFNTSVRHFEDFILLPTGSQCRQNTDTVFVSEVRQLSSFSYFKSQIVDRTVTLLNYERCKYYCDTAKAWTRDFMLFTLP
jgi:hypothetical protein